MQPNRQIGQSQSILKNTQLTTPVGRDSLFSKKAMSLGSTTTLVMNEKAKALREEITTLDDEIQQLQKNLKRAMSKKEERKHFD